ncbi:MAG: SDR family oxidoreductase [Desulfovibrionaceae bacterium]|jgi:NAD(P)-dependent dehydrogenase (short-subunit alcohol dehydrogenase family)|nr:SDR family oxidoreductase [Desulfovibrionaceae bacterium]
MHSVKQAFDLTGRVAVITGGAGLLGVKHAEAVAEMGGCPVLLDIDEAAARERAAEIAATFGVRALGLAVDITAPEAVEDAARRIEAEFGPVSILINNAANNPKMEDAGKNGPTWSRLENFPLDVWNADISVGLTGAFLCSRVFGAAMAERGAGVILNVASDLGVIAPDQRLYRVDGAPEHAQPVKPVTYSVVKTGLVGLTRYLATYWAGRGVRANAISPGGVFNGQDEAFVARLANLIPMGRMARKDEYKAAIVFLVSDASSYMTGVNVVIDGGRTCW